MKHLSNILTATDFSSFAHKAALRALSLAKEHNAKLHVIHVDHTPITELVALGLGIDRSDAVAKATSATRDRLSLTVRSLKAAAEVSVRGKMLRGEFHRALDRYLHAQQVDLCVLGAHGEHFVRDLFIGGSADRLLRTSPVPTLLVRQDPGKPYRRVLVCVDLSPRSTAALQAARTVAPDAHLHVLHVSDNSVEDKLRRAGLTDKTIKSYHEQARRKADAAMSRLLEDAGVPARATPQLAQGSIVRAILDRCSRDEIDLVVIGKRRRGAVEGFLLGSVTSMMIHETRCDLLVVTGR